MVKDYRITRSPSIGQDQGQEKGRAGSTSSEAPESYTPPGGQDQAKPRTGSTSSEAPPETYTPPGGQSQVPKKPRTGSTSSEGGPEEYTPPGGQVPGKPRGGSTSAASDASEGQGQPKSRAGSTSSDGPETSIPFGAQGQAKNRTGSATSEGFEPSNVLESQGQPKPRSGSTNSEAPEASIPFGGQGQPKSRAGSTSSEARKSSGGAGQGQRNSKTESILDPAEQDKADSEAFDPQKAFGSAEGQGQRNSKSGSTGGQSQRNSKSGSTGGQSPRNSKSESMLDPGETNTTTSEEVSPNKSSKRGSDQSAAGSAAGQPSGRSSPTPSLIPTPIASDPKKRTPSTSSEVPSQGQAKGQRSASLESKRDMNSEQPAGRSSPTPSLTPTEQSNKNHQSQPKSKSQDQGQSQGQGQRSSSVDSNDLARASFSSVKDSVPIQAKRLETKSLKPSTDTDDHPLQVLHHSPSKNRQAIGKILAKPAVADVVTAQVGLAKAQVGLAAALRSDDTSYIPPARQQPVAGVTVPNYSMLPEDSASEVALTESQRSLKKKLCKQSKALLLQQQQMAALDKKNAFNQTIKITLSSQRLDQSGSKTNRLGQQNSKSRLLKNTVAANAQFAAGALKGQSFLAQINLLEPIDNRGGQNLTAGAVEKYLNAHPGFLSSYISDNVDASTLQGWMANSGRNEINCLDAANGNGGRFQTRGRCYDPCTAPVQRCRKRKKQRSSLSALMNYYVQGPQVIDWSQNNGIPTYGGTIATAKCNCGGQGQTILAPSSKQNLAGSSKSNSKIAQKSSSGTNQAKGQAKSQTKGQAKGQAGGQCQGLTNGSYYQPGGWYV